MGRRSHHTKAGPGRAGWTPVLAAFGLALCACAGIDESPPEVLGIRFGTRVADLPRGSIPQGEKADNYFLIPFHGYKLSYPNPEGWTVFVADSAPAEIEDRVIYAVALTRDLGRDCIASDRNELAERLLERYREQFDHGAVIEEEKEEVSTAVLASDRRFLSASARCFVKSVSAVFAYVDLDRFRYVDTVDAAGMVERVRTTVSQYQARTLSR